MTVRRYVAGVGVVVTAVLYVLVLVLGQVQSRSPAVGRPSAEPSVAGARWRVGVGYEPAQAAITPQAVVLTVQVYDGPSLAIGLAADNGRERWRHPAEYVLFTGAAENPAALLGHVDKPGFDVVDVSNGAVRWADADAGTVWAYSDLVVTLTCPDASGQATCTLAGRSPLDGVYRWQLAVPGAGGLGHARDYLDAGRVRQLNVSRAPLPAHEFLVLPLLDGVAVVSTATGRVVRTLPVDPAARVFAAGGRVVVSRAVWRAGVCERSVEGQDATTGAVVWRKDGYDLGTVTGSACQQGDAPDGGRDVIRAVWSGNREVLFSARDGRELWVGEPDESVLVTDGAYAVVARPDRKKILIVDVSKGTTIDSYDDAQDVTAQLADGAILVYATADRTVSVARIADRAPFYTGDRQLDVFATAAGAVVGDGFHLWFVPS